FITSPPAVSLSKSDIALYAALIGGAVIAGIYGAPRWLVIVGAVAVGGVQIVLGKRKDPEAATAVPMPRLPWKHASFWIVPPAIVLMAVALWLTEAHPAVIGLLCALATAVFVYNVIRQIERVHEALNG